jgi:hypothetical protein
MPSEADEPRGRRSVISPVIPSAQRLIPPMPLQIEPSPFEAKWGMNFVSLSVALLLPLP